MRITFIIMLSALFALSGSAQDAEVAFKKAENLFASGKYEEAEKLYSQVIESGSKNMNAYLRRAFCRSVLERYDESIADYSHVIDKHPKHPFAYLSRGSAYNKMEKWQDALIDFNMVLNIDPKNLGHTHLNEECQLFAIMFPQPMRNTVALDRLKTLKKQQRLDKPVTGRIPLENRNDICAC